MRIYTGLIKDLGCRCFYYDSGMNIPIGSVCAEIPDIVSILMSRKGLPHFYEHIAIKREGYISFVMSRFNGIMDSYDVYNSISVDDVRDMVKDITEDKLIIQYCS